jgi:hypothetical protein
MEAISDFLFSPISLYADPSLSPELIPRKSDERSRLLLQAHLSNRVKVDTLTFKVETLSRRNRARFGWGHGAVLVPRNRC